MIARRIKAIADLSFYFLSLPWATLYGKNKDYWLISERGDDARDNGYWMFKHLREHHPEVNAVYAISGKSADYPKAQSLGKVVRHGSFAHWIVFCSAKVRMSTHLFLFAPSPYVGQWLKKHHSTRSVNVDLQHGITHNTFPSTYKEINGSDLYICGARPEYEWVKSNFHWDDGSIAYTGFARFDGLHGLNTKRQVLIMPSWRTELHDANEETFLASPFYRSWNGVLHDKTLAEALVKNNVELVLYLHYSLQEFSHAFQSKEPHIRIVSFAEGDVQNLLKESALLITDYSSVFFDFAYMFKPLIYFQFDVDDFYSKHYKRGFFDHAKDGFGPVVSDADSLVTAMKHYIETDFQMESVYKKRAEAFFPLHDVHNCERIYQAITRLQNERKDD